MTYSHKQVIVIRKDLNMRKGKIAAQAAHASMKAILDLAWPAQAITLAGVSPRFDGKTEVVPGVQISGDYLCIPNGKDIKPWLDGTFTKICVYVNSEEELLSVYDKAREAGLIASLIKDAGLTEFDGVPTLTCAAIGPGPSEKIDTITGKLGLL